MKKQDRQQPVQLELFASPSAPAGTPAPLAPQTKPAQSPRKPRREPVQLDLFAPQVAPAGIKAPSVKWDVPVEAVTGSTAGAAQSEVPAELEAGADAGAAELEVPAELEAGADAGAAQLEVPAELEAGADAGAAQLEVPAELEAGAEAIAKAQAVKPVSQKQSRKKQSRKKQSPDKPAVSPQAQQSPEEIVVPYAGVASKSEQSPDKPVVKCHIRIEKIGVTKRGNTPYIVYHTQYGKCCTFLSREYFWQSLFNLLGIKQQRFDRVTGFAVSESSVALLEGEKRHSIAGDELRAFLARQNQMALDGLEVRLQEGKVSVWNRASRRLHVVTAQGCNCEDAMYSKQICKHQIAAQWHLQKLGWGLLEGYLALDYSTMPTEQLMAISEGCMADLGW
ncbi:hypothetical protein [Kamptonema formosum]|uniref:hypothetical protein n=1 Tax=Kamptonema formosum TaxID=331992 RepID=UPI0012DD7091|nr:hypothetical protein [Oscillatoria sp. PCC 10802]